MATLRQIIRASIADRCLKLKVQEAPPLLALCYLGADGSEPHKCAAVSEVEQAMIDCDLLGMAKIKVPDTDIDAGEDEFRRAMRSSLNRLTRLGLVKYIKGGPPRYQLTGESIELCREILSRMLVPEITKRIIESSLHDMANRLGHAIAVGMTK